MIRAWVAIGSLLLAHAAHAGWESKVGRQTCELSGPMVDAEGKVGATLEIKWRRPDVYSVGVWVARTAPAGVWHIESVSKRDQQPVVDGKMRHLMIHDEAAAQVRRDLAAGRDVALAIQYGSRNVRYSTGNRSADETVLAFEKCVAETKATAEPPPPPASWVMETQGGRDCTLALNSVSGVRGLNVDFRVRHKVPLSFQVYAKADYFDGGGVLRIVLPGDPQPFAFEAAKYSSEPRTKALLQAFGRLQPLDMVFTPRGGKPIPLRTTTDGLELASAMFDACATALRPDVLPERNSFADFRYAVAAIDGSCEFTGTYQVDGNAIWISLVSDGRKNMVKATRRTVGSGVLIRSLGLEKLGGPRKLSAQDATFELDATQFAALRRDLIGKGREFRVEMSAEKAYTVHFGGELAVVEAPMFEACVHTRFDAR